MSTGAPVRASSQAVPTSGWPASGSSTVGVKIRSAPVAASSTNTVSEKPRSAATAWRSAAGDRGAVEHDAERVAALAAGAEEDAEGVEGGHADERATPARVQTSERSRHQR